jgi:hypothetical protein
MSIRAPLFFLPQYWPGKGSLLLLEDAVCDHKGLGINLYKRSLTTWIGQFEMVVDEFCLGMSNNGRELFFPQLPDLIDRPELL